MQELSTVLLEELPQLDPKPRLLPDWVDSKYLVLICVRPHGTVYRVDLVEDESDLSQLLDCERRLFFVVPRTAIAAHLPAPATAPTPKAV